MPLIEWSIKGDKYKGSVETGTAPAMSWYVLRTSYIVLNVSPGCRQRPFDCILLYDDYPHLDLDGVISRCCRGPESDSECFSGLRIPLSGWTQKFSYENLRTLLQPFLVYDYRALRFHLLGSQTGGAARHRTDDISRLSSHPRLIAQVWHAASQVSIHHHIAPRQAHIC